jgi:hypothetical protein
MNLMKKNQLSAHIVVMSLHLDWCSHQAAKYAVTHWHYSKVMPAGKTLKVGVWEDEQFIGAIIYSRGANKHLGRPYGLDQDGCCELTRVALREHKTPVSKMMAISFKFLRKHCPDLRLIISYADPMQGHHGGIYQATNWIYEGAVEMRWLRIHGKLVHPRSVYSKYKRQAIGWLRAHVDPKAEWVEVPAKHKYLMPLDNEMRKQITPLHKPYPKRKPD